MKNKTMKKSPKFSNNTKNITKIFLEMLNTVKFIIGKLILTQNIVLQMHYIKI